MDRRDYIKYSSLGLISPIIAGCNTQENESDDNANGDNDNNKTDNSDNNNSEDPTSKQISVSVSTDDNTEVVNYAYEENKSVFDVVVSNIDTVARTVFVDLTVVDDNGNQIGNIYGRTTGVISPNSRTSIQYDIEQNTENIHGFNISVESIRS